MCLGVTFALLEMRVVLATLLGAVRLKRVGRSLPVRRGIALAPDDGVRATVVARHTP